MVVLGSNTHSARMDDGDECFDLDNLEYASDFGAPTDRSSGEVVAMIQGGRWTGPGLGAVLLAVGAGKPDTLIAGLIRV